MSKILTNIPLLWHNVFVRKLLFPAAFCFSLIGLFEAQDTREATSLLGKPLYAPELTAEERVELEKNLMKAKSDYAHQQNADALIWVGRRTAYLGRFRDAIDIFSEGIEKYPNDPRFYRHRGHRYLSIRSIDKAITDFEKAAHLIQERPDEIETDGIPNVRNIPRSTINSNIWYHLGLAHYLKGDFDKAVRAYKECLNFSKNDDMLVATSHWLYMALRRSGKKEEANEVLEPIHEKMDIIEDADYYALLLLYKGLKTPEALLQQRAADLSNVTIGYGVGNWYLYNGDKEKAFQIFKRVLESPLWPAFGYLAAEAELARSAVTLKLTRN